MVIASAIRPSFRSCLIRLMLGLLDTTEREEGLDPVLSLEVDAFPSDSVVEEQAAEIRTSIANMSPIQVDEKRL